MRVSTDPTDPAYVDDRPRRAWCNDVEITDWTVADEFRRSVIDKSGKVHNGSVRVERLPDAGKELPPMEIFPFTGPRWVLNPSEGDDTFAGWTDQKTMCVWFAKHGEDPNVTRDPETGQAYPPAPVPVPPAKKSHKAKKRR